MSETCEMKFNSVKHKFLFSKIGCTTTTYQAVHAKDLRVSVDCNFNASKQYIMTAKKANAILAYINRRIMFQTKERITLLLWVISQSIARILGSGQGIPI